MSAQFKLRTVNWSRKVVTAASLSRSYKAKPLSGSTQDAVPSSLFILLLY